MSRLWLVTLLAASIFFIDGCNKSASTGTGQQAVVLLKDGTSFGGTVTASSPTEITLQAPNGDTRTYPMTQVDSVQYSSGATTSAAAPAPASPAAPPAPANQPQPVASAPPAAPATPTQAPPPPVQAEVPAPQEVVRIIPAGANLVVRNNELIDSKTAGAGQTFSGVIVRDVLDRDGRVIIPHGSDATLVVRDARGQGKVEGQSLLVLDLDSVRVAGRRYRVETSDVVEKGHEGVGANKRTAAFGGGGAVLGTLIGALAGGGKGAAIGALSGGGAGVATQALTRGKGVRVAPETVMTFRLEAPVRVTEIR